MSKKLTNPKGGMPLETSGQPVTDTPIEGGVAMINASVPPDHPAHVVYREQTTEEKKDARKRAEEAERNS